ncbi:MAG: sugar nucleotide-binding protein [Planctomycetaceae bacterium]|nr:sugar nucleotide-binding protein [Planctomycetaceae bacterium]
MESLLVVGVDTVVGANIAASLADRHRVLTWAPERRYDIAGCQALDPADTVCQVVEASKPDRIVYCGPAARSIWDPRSKASITEAMVDQAREWAAAAKEANAEFTMISSDALFTGPWMFHDEESPGQCHSIEALTVRATEEQVQEQLPGALIIRTNAFGWSPDPSRSGWLEKMLAEVESRRVVEQDHIRHATPILATDLADILDRAHAERLTGVFHVAGAERVSPLKFAQRLADQFDLPWLALRRDSALSAPPQGFGLGECSLQTKRIRKALCVAMPLLSEGLARLEAQHVNGYRQQLTGSAPAAQVRAA